MQTANFVLVYVLLFLPSSETSLTIWSCYAHISVFIAMEMLISKEMYNDIVIIDGEQSMSKLSGWGRH